MHLAAYSVTSLCRERLRTCRCRPQGLEEADGRTGAAKATVRTPDINNHVAYKLQIAWPGVPSGNWTCGVRVVDWACPCANVTPAAHCASHTMAVNVHINLPRAVAMREQHATACEPVHVAPGC